MLAITAEYTEWSVSSQHPMTFLKQTADALHDASVVAPIVTSATQLSGKERNTFFYILKPERPQEELDNQV